MNFKVSIRSGFNNYTNFKGRAQRSEFWYWVLFFWLCEIAAVIVDSLLFPNAYNYDSPSAVVLALPTNIVGYVLLIPNISMFVRRLHDTDRRGWWWLISFVPFGGLALLIWMCSKGTPGSNRFGEGRIRAAEDF